MMMMNLSFVFDNLGGFRIIMILGAGSLAVSEKIREGIRHPANSTDFLLSCTYSPVVALLA